MADGKSQNAPEPLQLTQMVLYGQSLQEHRDYDQAIKYFHDGSVMAENNHLPERQGLALIFQSEAEHERFIADNSKPPDTLPGLTALRIFESARDKGNAAFAALQLGKSYSDLDDAAGADTFYSRAEWLWNDQPAQQALVLRTRWRQQVGANLRKLATKAAATRAVKRVEGTFPSNIDPLQSRALAALRNSEFSNLEKCFIDSSHICNRSDDCYELNDYVLNGIGNIDSDSERQWEGRLLQMANWCKHSGKSVNPHLALASFYGSYAQAVVQQKDPKLSTPENSREYFRRLNLTAIELGKALDTDVVRPEWYQLAALNIANNGDKDDRKLFEQVIDAGNKNYPDYMPVYLVNATYLQPSYYGSSEEWLKYVTATADSFGGETGDMLYAAMVEDAQKHDKNLRTASPDISWARVARGTAGCSFKGKGYLR